MIRQPNKQLLITRQTVNAIILVALVQFEWYIEDVTRASGSGSGSTGHDRSNGGSSAFSRWPQCFLVWLRTRTAYFTLHKFYLTQKSSRDIKRYSRLRNEQQTNREIYADVVIVNWPASIFLTRMRMVICTTLLSIVTEMVEFYIFFSNLDIFEAY